MIKLMNYSGSKAKFIKEINQFINKSSKKIYIEPFVGSGAILFNLEKEFDEYIINDLDRNLIMIFETFKQIDYELYINEVNKIFNEYGDISKNKESYYNFRNYFNQNYWSSNSIKEGIYLQILSGSCINSFMRFGPNGFNQSYGRGKYIINEESFDKIKIILNKVKIYNIDFREIFNKNKDALYFIDPPYFSRPSSYAKFKEDDVKDLLNYISSLDEFIYTDILNDYNKHIKDRKLLRKIRTSAPLVDKKELTDSEEYIFYSKKLEP